MTKNRRKTLPEASYDEEDAAAVAGAGVDNVNIAVDGAEVDAGAYSDGEAAEDALGAWVDDVVALVVDGDVKVVSPPMASAASDETVRV